MTYLLVSKYVRIRLSAKVRASTSSSSSVRALLSYYGEVYDYNDNDYSESNNHDCYKW
jgi:hypothetical protein